MKLLKPFVVMLGMIIGVAAAENVNAAEAGLAKPFTNVAMKTTGKWSIETRADGNYIVLADNFKTRGAPDLKIFLHTLAAGDIENDNAAEGLFIAELKSKKGAQEYKIPANVNLSDYQSLVIHCEQYTKFWAAGSL
ncbi:DM13 domain-containing protein [Kordiimonas aquimaris]|uniref:DM13 domain-containing protein n=1 Tax=Kordiimonas aquimaris TaxID=707591 RepID=UPI0021CEF2EA|nr:DM13 domain-containing protein [Kordiimonas aquimaris]